MECNIKKKAIFCKIFYARETPDQVFLTGFGKLLRNFGKLQ